MKTDAANHSQRTAYQRLKNALILTAFAAFTVAITELAVRLTHDHQRGATEQRIYEAIREGRLRPTVNGLTVLPASDQWLTSDGNVYVTKTPAFLVVLFPLRQGRDTNFTGQVILNRPLRPSDTTERLGEAGPYQVLYLNTPRMDTLYGRKAPLEVAVGRKINPNEYEAHRLMD